MAQHPLQIFERLDPQLLKLSQSGRELALAEGTLPRKYKLLIAMALDAAHGATDGVKSLTQQAMQAGASKEEVTETLRIVYLLCGVGSLYITAPALRELF